MISSDQRAQGGDALPGQPREGQPPERAGGSALQVGPPQRSADRVGGHGPAPQGGGRHAAGKTRSRSS